MNFAREAYRIWLPIPTRWEDFDVYGHVNNVKYFAYFDTAINRFLIEAGGLNPVDDDVVGYVVNSYCTFKGSFRFPEVIDAGLVVTKVGNTSVTHRVGLFGAGESTARAVGECTHVFVSRRTGVSAPIPEKIRAAWVGAQ